MRPSFRATPSSSAMAGSAGRLVGPDAILRHALRRHRRFRQRITALREQGIEVVSGNAVTREVLDLANLQGARSLVIAIPNAFEACRRGRQGRACGPIPAMLIVARAFRRRGRRLKQYARDTVIMGEREIAMGMLDRLSSAS